MATTEPRLMHLLNNSQVDRLPPIQLPPIATEHPQSLSLPTLEPDVVAQRGGDQAPPRPTARAPPLPAVNNSYLPRLTARPEAALAIDDSGPHLTATTRPLNLLLGDPDPPTSSTPLSVRMLVEDAVSDLPDDASNKKRHHALSSENDVFQLPHPLKKQKSAQLSQLSQQAMQPPVIAGLRAPPPSKNVAVFPPITPGSFDDGEPPSLGLLREFTSSAANQDRRARRNSAGSLTPVEPTDQTTNSTNSTNVSQNNQNATASKKRATRPRKKWSDEETNTLLLGVSRHGVGKWTNILEDRDFQFNGRSAGDLKDRFRTCCPDELRAELVSKSRSEDGDTDRAARLPPAPAPAPPPPPPAPATAPPPTPAPPPRASARHRGPMCLEDILFDGSVLGTPPQDKSRLPGQPKPRKSRAHRKKMEDLVELGINSPFKPSPRRERRPFTAEDDKRILDGVAVYGPSWTKIQRDPKFKFENRKPTDLRDRVRNKYPDVYARMEKVPLPAQDGGQPGSVPESCGGTPTDTPTGTPGSGPPEMHVKGEPQLNYSSSRESMQRWPSTPAHGASTESLVGPADIFEMTTAATTSTTKNEAAHKSLSSSTCSAPEMDIGRLLLDDSRTIGKDQMKREPGVYDHSLPSNGRYPLARGSFDSRYYPSR